MCLLSVKSQFYENLKKFEIFSNFLSEFFSFLTLSVVKAIRKRL